MKTSQLIQKLQALKDLHGDLWIENQGGVLLNTVRLVVDPHPVPRGVAIYLCEEEDEDALDGNYVSAMIEKEKGR